MSTVEEIEQESVVVAPPTVLPEQQAVVVDYTGTVHLSGIVVGDGAWTGVRVRTALGTVVEVELAPGQRAWSVDFAATIVGSGEHALALQLQDGLATVATEVVLLTVTRYEAPRVRFVEAPQRLNTYDGFVVRGTVEGSEAEGEPVVVGVAGVTRTGTVSGGEFEVRFGDGVLDHSHAGVRPVVATVTDRRDNTTKETAWVTVDEFHGGYVHLDPVDAVVPEPGEGLTCTGELELGTHREGRELAVLLVAADADERVVGVGAPAVDWEHGTFVAVIPVDSVGSGRYRVRVLLTDDASPRLVRSAVSRPFRLGAGVGARVGARVEDRSAARALRALPVAS